MYCWSYLNLYLGQILTARSNRVSTLYFICRRYRYQCQCECFCLCFCFFILSSFKATDGDFTSISLVDISLYRIGHISIKYLNPHSVNSHDFCMAHWTNFIRCFRYAHSKHNANEHNFATSRYENSLKMCKWNILLKYLIMQLCKIDKWRQKLVSWSFSLTTIHFFKEFTLKIRQISKNLSK